VPDPVADPTVDVLTIGNALVDVLSNVDDRLLAECGLARGAMTLVDAQRALDLYAALPAGIEASGGCAANTAVGVVSLGGSAAFVGRVADDQLGAVFAHDIRAAGVRFESDLAAGGQPTGRCLIAVTPDGERTMNTFLGAAAELAPADIREDLVGVAAVTYLEGYLWDEPEAKDAMRVAIAHAHGHGRRVALSLSDPFCVDRHRAEFVSLVGQVDLVFCNEAEAIGLVEAATLEDALRRLAGCCPVVVVTRGPQGVTVLAEGARTDVVADPVDKVVDTTGAGDLFAAGYLRGVTTGADTEACARLGALAAAEVIGHLGARPQTRLAELAAGRGLL
jgi:sugar/nucleoside kinase (ribokinase family)